MRIFGHKSLVASNLLRYVPMLRQTSVMPQNEPMALIDRPMVETTICHHCIGRYNAVGAETIQLRADTDKRNWLHALMEEQRKQYRAAAAAQSAKGPPKIVASDKELMSL